MWTTTTMARAIWTGTVATPTTSTTPTISSLSVSATHFISSSYYLAGEFLFWARDFEICPFQPPSILPISSKGSDKWMYFLLSNDFVSQRIRIKTLIVSSLRIASLTQGCFSLLSKNVAIEMASIISINKLSIFIPSVYLCVLSNFV